MKPVVLAIVVALIACGGALAQDQPAQRRLHTIIGAVARAKAVADGGKAVHAVGDLIGTKVSGAVSVTQDVAGALKHQAGMSIKADARVAKAVAKAAGKTAVIGGKAMAANVGAAAATVADIATPLKGPIAGVAADVTRLGLGAHAVLSNEHAKITAKVGAHRVKHAIKEAASDKARAAKRTTEVAASSVAEAVRNDKVAAKKAAHAAKRAAKSAVASAILP